ncbi:hypothetical protein ACP4OV_000244 [Aristida adscensionis]
MAVLKLNRLMSMHRQRRRRQIRAPNKLIVSRPKRNCLGPLQDEKSLCHHQIKGYSLPNLPEDIWCQIHSLMAMQDAARVACVSQAFLHSWRCHPNLSFSEETLGLNKNGCEKGDEKAKDFTVTVDHILKNHSGLGVKRLQIKVPSVYYVKESCHFTHLDSWLQAAVKPGIEEINLRLSTADAEYNFPCSLLSDGTEDTLIYLLLASCNFHPTVELGCLRNLIRLQLSMVRITGDELGCFLSNSSALEQLELMYCNDIICLRIPCLQQLSYLEVLTCSGLQVIESKAPNLSSFRFAGDPHVQLSLGDTLRIKKLDWFCSGAAFYACTELPFSMPNLETLKIYSKTEMINTPMVPSKFHQLKYLSVALGGRTYDYLSLVSLLDTSPSLETFILSVQPERGRVSVFEDPSYIRRIPEQRNNKLQCVNIINFTSAKSLVELARHILESASSLKSLTLDTSHGLPRCSVNKSGKCVYMRKDALVEAYKALLAVQTYIRSKVPSTVELTVLEPCSRCHAVEL